MRSTRPTSDTSPPRAERVDHSVVAHDHSRQDPYFWLRDRDSTEVRAYLEAENAYTQAQMAHTDNLQRALFEEIVARQKPDDSSVPYLRDDFYYYRRFEPGLDYPVYCRRADRQIARVAESARGSHAVQRSPRTCTAQHCGRHCGAQEVDRQLG